MELIKVTLEQILNLLPKTVTLHYVDYRDSLDEHLDIIQECLTNKNKDALYEKIDEWFIDDYSGMEYVKEELAKDMQEAFDIDEDEAAELLEEYIYLIEDAIYERDDSSILPDLLKNTHEPALFIDTGLSFNGYGNTNAEYRADRKQIKKFFNIKNSDQDAIIDMMLMQAGYGGELRVYFNEDLEVLLNAVEEGLSVEFNGRINIAIANSGNGSGDHCEIVGKCKLPLDVFVCHEVKYSYTHEVCGMYSDWCGSTEFQYISEDIKSVDSITREFMLREAELDKTFKAGKCTPFDMKYSRHRNTVYINDYPCGNKCLDCGTFWID